MFKRENWWVWATAVLLAVGLFGCEAEARMHTEFDPAHGWIQYAKQVERELGLPEKLLSSTCSTESDWRPNLVGTAGEIGLCQMKPGTLALLVAASPTELYDPYFAIYYAGVYYQWLIKRVGTRDPDVLALAYNQGPYSAAVQYVMKVRSRR